MMSFKNDEGVPLRINPNLLLCGPTNEAAARTLLMTQVNAAGASNPWYNTAQILVSPWLT
jgi:phage major head subunit gpT-like protein